MRGLKGNAVEIGNSSRCCKFLPPAEAQKVWTFFATVRSEREGVETGTSQKTCLVHAIRSFREKGGGTGFLSVLFHGNPLDLF